MKAQVTGFFSVPRRWWTHAPSLVLYACTSDSTYRRFTMSIQPDGPAPYAPAATVLGFIKRYRDHGLRPPFDTETLVKTGVTESLAPRTLQALKLLDLVDDEGQPTDRLKDLAQASSDEYQPRLAELVRAAYAAVLAFADPAVDDAKRIEDAFRGYTPRGQRARMVSLFLGLCQEAGIAAPSPSRRPAQPTKRQVAPPRAGSAHAKRAPLATSSDGLPPALSGLLAELPVPGAPWTRQRRDTFLRTLGSVLDFLYPVREDDVQSDDRLEELR